MSDPSNGAAVIFSPGQARMNERESLFAFVRHERAPHFVTTNERNQPSTPPAFRDVLPAMARSAAVPSGTVSR